MSYISPKTQRTRKHHSPHYLKPPTLNRSRSRRHRLPRFFIFALFPLSFLLGCACVVLFYLAFSGQAKSLVFPHSQKPNKVLTNDDFPSGRAQKQTSLGQQETPQSALNGLPTRIFDACTSKKNPSENAIAIREFMRSGRRELLLVNPQTLETRIEDAADWERRQTTFDEQKNTLYVKQLLSFTENASDLQNVGLTHATRSNLASPILTIDLCPSSRPFEKKLFESLIDGRVGKPVPVSICVTGLWMEDHPQEFNWLKQLAETKELSITWVNHSFSHPYYKSKPLDQNFLLSIPLQEFPQEILKVEEKLLSQGLPPSVFFRFPGLISNQEYVNTLQGFGLIPLGSDAWLAKGETPRPGSIILVHGNGNEPPGIKLFLQLLASSKIRGLSNLIDSVSEPASLPTASQRPKKMEASTKPPSVEYPQYGKDPEKSKEPKNPEKQQN